jgi:hypothetical protein
MSVLRAFFPYTTGAAARYAAEDVDAAFLSE